MKRAIKDVLRKIYIAADPLNIFVYKLMHPNSRPIPPAINRMRVGSRGIGQYMDAGRNCYRPLRAAIQTYYRDAGKSPRILDFGCGVGRVLQYFFDENVELYACDIDSSAVAYVETAFPGVNTSLNDYQPVLPYASDQFDIVYSVSVWTHLPPDRQIPWLMEVKRILRPGGLGLLTTIGTYGYRKGTHLQAVTFSFEDLVRTGFQYSNYAAEKMPPETGPSYGVAFHSPQYIRSEWSKYLRVLDVQEGVIDDLNDLVVVEKK